MLEVYQQLPSCLAHSFCSDEAALVFLLLVCKLTVATGTLSGLVLYANIIRLYD